MSNWFEDNPIKSIITYSITLVAATTAVFYFVLFENQSNLYSKEKERLKTQIQTLNERINLLQYDNENYLSENTKLREWLKSTPGSLEFLEEKMNRLEGNVTSLDTSNSSSIKSSNTLYYNQSSMLYKGIAYLDKKTGVSIGINSISSNRTGAGLIHYPDGTEVKFEEEKAGKQWSFTYNEINYKLILLEINYIADKYRVAVREE